MPLSSLKWALPTGLTKLDAKWKSSGWTAEMQARSDFKGYLLFRGESDDFVGILVVFLCLFFFSFFSFSLSKDGKVRCCLLLLFLFESRCSFFVVDCRWFSLFYDVVVVLILMEYWFFLYFLYSCRCYFLCGISRNGILFSMIIRFVFWWRKANTLPNLRFPECVCMYTNYMWKEEDDDLRYKKGFYPFSFILLSLK